MCISPPSRRQMLDSARTSFAQQTMLAAQAKETNREFGVTQIMCQGITNSAPRGWVRSTMDPPRNGNFSSCVKHIILKTTWVINGSRHTVGMTRVNSFLHVCCVLYVLHTLILENMIRFKNRKGTVIVRDLQADNTCWLLVCPLFGMWDPNDSFTSCRRNGVWQAFIHAVKRCAWTNESDGSWALQHVVTMPGPCISF